MKRTPGLTSPIIWNDESCSLRIMRLDEEHRYLLDLINEVIGVLDKNEDIGEAMNVWQIQFMQYSAIHFFREEQIMERYLSDWHLRDSHVKTHSAYWDSISKISSQSDPNTLAVFLKNWWSGHIQGIDRLMGEELRGRGVSELDLEMLWG